MAFRIGDIRDAFESPGDWAFRAWAYSSHDRLDEVLRPGYFYDMGGMLRIGDLIWVGLTHQPAGAREYGPPTIIRRSLGWRWTWVAPPIPTLPGGMRRRRRCR